MGDIRKGHCHAGNPSPSPLRRLYPSGFEVASALPRMARQKRFLRNMCRNDESSSEHVQRRLDLSYVRAMIEVEQTSNAAFAAANPFCQNSAADFLFPHRLVQSEFRGNKCRKSDETPTASRRRPRDDAMVVDVAAECSDEAIDQFLERLDHSRPVGQGFGEVGEMLRVLSRPPAPAVAPDRRTVEICPSDESTSPGTAGGASP